MREILILSTFDVKTLNAAVLTTSTRSFRSKNVHMLNKLPTRVRILAQVKRIAYALNCRRSTHNVRPLSHRNENFIRIRINIDVIHHAEWMNVGSFIGNDVVLGQVIKVYMVRN